MPAACTSNGEAITKDGEAITKDKGSATEAPDPETRRRQPHGGGEQAEHQRDDRQVQLARTRGQPARSCLGEAPRQSVRTRAEAIRALEKLVRALRAAGG
jgi:hypothetical protein